MTDHDNARGRDAEGRDAEGRRLDPADWAGFEAGLHDLLDACTARLQNARDLPWRAPPEDMAQALRLDAEQPGADPVQVMQDMAEQIMPYATGNTHPRFFGWVHGTGLPIGVAAEMVAATMNANLGGRNHGAMEIERAVLRWLCDIAGLPAQAFGVLTAGTSQATVLALGAARVARFGDALRKDGIAGLPAVRVYASQGAHSCVPKALELLGHGRNALVQIPLREGRMDIAALRAAIARDVAAGHAPLMIVATAGSVNTGYYDDLDALGDVAAQDGLWLHVDAAFGFWTRIAQAPWRGLSDGMARADSIACDMHKWLSVPYDCGACLVRDGALLHAAFAERPDYLLSGGSGLSGGAHWFCDYGMDLSRGFRALKVWAAVRTHGVAAFGAAVSDNCRQAAHMGTLAEASDWLDLACPVVSNVVCMIPRAGDADAIASALQTSGDAVFSTTRIDGRLCLRAAIVNHRTTRADVEHAVRSAEKLVQQARAKP